MADWTDPTEVSSKLSAVRDEQYAMLKAVNFNISELSIDNKSKFDMLEKLEQKYIAMLDALGLPDAMGESSTVSYLFAGSNLYGE